MPFFRDYVSRDFIETEQVYAAIRLSIRFFCGSYCSIGN